ncbi:MAG TPA: VTT domain-containing protein [Robiginitalea sp.]|nr:VTT domain-containing protein [Robiginitalea sp.]
MDLLELITHTDDYLNGLIAANLIVAYLVIFLIIYCESAFITFPFLPGDGLLFSVGVVSAATPLNIVLIIILLIAAAVLGNLTNYGLGLRFGKWVLTRQNRMVANYYGQAHEFMDKYGEKAVIIGRFFPILRTYLPFVAGMVAMPYRTFFRLSVIGAIAWVMSFALAGNLLGEVPWVRENYGLIFLGLIIITLLPFLLKALAHLISRRGQ